MSLQIGQALQDGVDELTSERGLLFVAVFVIFGLVNQVVSQSLSAAFNRYLFDAMNIPPSATVGRQSMGGASTAMAVDIPLPIAAVLALVMWLVSVALLVLAIRAFADDGDDPLPSSATRNLLPTVGIMIAVQILTSIAVGIGSLLLLIPGLVLAILFVFVKQEVALNDSGVIESIKNSIDIVGDNIVGVVVLLLVTVALGILLTIPFTLSLLALPPTVATVVSGVLGQTARVFGIAVITSAYVQATADDGGFGSAEESVGTSGNGFDTSDGI